jgi:hypothetical protein
MFLLCVCFLILSFLIGALNAAVHGLHDRAVANPRSSFSLFRSCCEKEDCKFLLRPRQGALHFSLLSKEIKSLTQGEIATAMVYVDSWDTFVERSISLFRADPVAVSCFNLLNI